jgi:Kdo-III transferase WaaZ
MRVISKLRKKLYRRRIAPPFNHMKTLHPDFRLEDIGDGPGSCAILWKGKTVGRTQPLRALTPPRSPECFIVASGPSLAEVEFDRLDDRVCFGVNGSIVKSVETGVPFAYHAITDRTFVQNRFDLVCQALDSGADCLFTFRVLSQIAEREPGLLGHDRIFLLTEMNAVYGVPQLAPAAFDAWAAGQVGVHLHPTARLTDGRVGFSERLERGVFTGQTVVFVALQVCYALGFRRVFILGMDLGAGGTYARFYERGDAATQTHLYRDFEPYIVPSFELARQVTAPSGFEIYNLAPHSRLPAEVIPKLSFEAALAMGEDTASLPARGGACGEHERERP